MGWGWNTAKLLLFKDPSKFYFTDFRTHPLARLHCFAKLVASQCYYMAFGHAICCQRQHNMPSELKVPKSNKAAVQHIFLQQALLLLWVTLLLDCLSLIIARQGLLFLCWAFIFLRYVLNMLRLRLNKLCFMLLLLCVWQIKLVLLQFGLEVSQNKLVVDQNNLIV
jgi:hypothetical protein